MIPLLNRWASLQHVAPGLARLCGWAPTPSQWARWADAMQSRAILGPSLRDVQRQQAEAPEYFGKTWDDLAINILEPDDGR